MNNKQTFYPILWKIVSCVIGEEWEGGGGTVMMGDDHEVTLFTLTFCYWHDMSEGRPVLPLPACGASDLLPE